MEVQSEISEEPKKTEVGEWLARWIEKHNQRAGEIATRLYDNLDKDTFRGKVVEKALRAGMALDTWSSRYNAQTFRSAQDTVNNVIARIGGGNK